jgi:hypothetical protein
MGFTEIPEQAQRGRNKAVLNLDKNELTQTINVLQKVVAHLNSNPNALPKFPAHPPSSIPDFLTTRISAPNRQSSISPVTVITPSVAALQQRLGLDLGSGLGLGPVGTFSTESTRYNDNGSISSAFSSSSMLAIPPIGPPSGSSRPGPISRPRSPLTNTNNHSLGSLDSDRGSMGLGISGHGDLMLDLSVLATLGCRQFVCLQARLVLFHFFIAETCAPCFCFSKLLICTALAYFYLFCSRHGLEICAAFPFLSLLLNTEG